MEEKKLHINAQPSEDGKPQTIFIREGALPDIFQPDPVKFARKDVTLASIAAYIATNRFNENVKDNRAVIIFSEDPDNAFIELLVDPTDTMAAHLRANLTINPEFTAFGINKGDKFSQKDLEKHIRKYAHCFENTDVVKDLIKRLQNFEVKYEQSVKRGDNRQGETEDLVTTGIKFAQGELPTTLPLKMPLFKNTDRVGFTVEIEIDRLSNNLPGFSFWSVDIQVQMRERAKDIIQAEIAKVRDGFTVLEV